MQEILKIYSKYISKSGGAAIHKSTLYNYFIVPFSAGLAGFASFLFILLLIDSAAYLLGITKSFQVGIEEVIIAAIGFTLKFAYQLIRSIREI